MLRDNLVRIPYFTLGYDQPSKGVNIDFYVNDFKNAAHCKMLVEEMLRRISTQDRFAGCHATHRLLMSMRSFIASELRSLVYSEHLYMNHDNKFVYESR